MLRIGYGEAEARVGAEPRVVILEMPPTRLLARFAHEEPPSPPLRGGRDIHRYCEQPNAIALPLQGRVVGREGQMSP
jgi:hypothetical protein